VLITLFNTYFESITERLPEALGLYKIITDAVYGSLILLLILCDQLNFGKWIKIAYVFDYYFTLPHKQYYAFQVISEFYVDFRTSKKFSGKHSSYINTPGNILNYMCLFGYIIQNLITYNCLLIHISTLMTNIYYFFRCALPISFLSVGGDFISYIMEEKYLCRRKLLLPWFHHCRRRKTSMSVWVL